jgi:hypothetical protein
MLGYKPRDRHQNEQHDRGKSVLSTPSTELAEPDSLYTKAYFFVSDGRDDNGEERMGRLLGQFYTLGMQGMCREPSARSNDRP